MIPLTKKEEKMFKKNEKKKSKKFAIYVKKDLVLMITIKNTIKDHCHYTGKSRCAAHNTCNLR